MKSNEIKTSCFLALLMTISIYGYGQSKGVLKGVVTDKATSSTLPGATIIIAGTTNGTITNIAGEYTLTNIPEGKNIIVFSFVSYKSDSLLIDIPAGEIKVVDVNLAPDNIGLDEVVVTAQLLGQRKAINQQLSSDGMVNIVSEEKLKELPDVNAAEALGRLPGVALQRSSGEGQKIAIRGMSPAFSAITINGIRLPSNDISDRSVNLSMISSESLAGIELFKSPTPDMDGEAIGGTVNLLLKKAPEKTTYELRGGGAYNQLGKSWNNYNVSGIFSNRILQNKLGLILQANAERIDRGAELFSGSYQFFDVILPNQFTITDRLEIRERFGGSINLDYRLPKGAITLFSYYGRTDRDITARRQIYAPYDNNNVRFGYSKTDIEMDVFTNMLSGEHNFQYFKIDWGASYSYTGNKTPYNSTINFWADDAYAHNPDISRDFTQWADSARVNYSRAYLKDGQLNTTDFNENNYSVYANIEVPLRISNAIKGNFKTGAKYRGLQRNLNNQLLSEEFYNLSGEMQVAINAYPFPLEMTPNNRIAMTNFIGDNPFIAGSFLDGAYSMINPTNGEIVSRWFEYQKSVLNNDRTSQTDNYDLTETVAAGYTMLKLVFFDQVTLISGLRYEQSDNRYNGITSTLSGRYGVNGLLIDTTTTQKYNNLLPHLHLRYKPLPWFDIRLSYAKTLARPSFDMVLPSSSYNFTLSTITAGNPNLKHMEANNFDATLSFYDGKFGLLAISGFYKDIKNIFFRVENYYFTTDSIAASFGFPGRKDFMLNSYDNSPEASVYGFEIDLQTNLNFLPAPFNGIVLSANITRQFSETHKYSFMIKDTLYRHPVTNRIIRERSLEETKRIIQMPGQSPFIFNAALGYDLKGFSGRVSANYQDKYLIFPGSSEMQDNFNWNFWRFDIALKQKINPNLSVFLNLINVNNMREESYRNSDTKYPGNILNSGPVFTFGFHLKI